MFDSHPHPKRYIDSNTNSDMLDSQPDRYIEFDTNNNKTVGEEFILMRSLLKKVLGYKRCCLQFQPLLWDFETCFIVGARAKF